MGMPARRIEANPFERRSNHLRLVTTPPAPALAPARKRPATTVKPKPSAKSGAATRARGRAAEARARAAFMAFLAVFTFAIVLGGARVTLIVQASEASIVQSRVQAAIKTQRAEVDQLEVDKSALSTPSRIAGIASTSMDMGEPASVRYISLPDPVAATSQNSGGAASAGSQDALGRLFDALVQLSAGEAQSLLVGDVGLAGSR
jgi:cell division protein FtsL